MIGQFSGPYSPARPLKFKLVLVAKLLRDRPRYKYLKKCSKFLSRNSHKIPKFLKNLLNFSEISFFSNVNLTHFLAVYQLKK